MARKRPRDLFAQQLKNLSTLKSYNQDLYRQFMMLEDATREAGDMMLRQHLQAEEQARKVLGELADRCFFLPGDMRKADIFQGDTYRSTNAGGMYAQALAHLLCCKARYLGLTAEVRKVQKTLPPNPFKGAYGEDTSPFRIPPCPVYEVWVAVESDLDLAILRYRNPFAFADEVRFLWASGGNPRVILPSLPHGVEASWGFDNFGRIINRVAFDKACGDIKARLPHGNHEASTWKPPTPNAALLNPG